MNLNDILNDKCFYLGMKADNKSDMTMELAQHFNTTHGLDTQEIYTALWNREQKGSTGLGKALAIPHARIPNVGSMKIVVCYDATGKDFDAYDSIPTKLFFAAIIDEDSQPQEQLEMLKTIVEACESTDLMTALETAHTMHALRDTLIRRIKEVQNG